MALCPGDHLGDLLRDLTRYAGVDHFASCILCPLSLVSDLDDRNRPLDQTQQQEASCSSLGPHGLLRISWPSGRVRSLELSCET